MPKRSRKNGRAPLRRARARDAAEGTAHVVNGIRRLDRGLRIAAREVQRVTGLSAAQLFVLEQLERAPGASLNELAALTLTDRTSVSAVVDRLVMTRLASRGTAPDDRRRAEIRLTAKGKAILARAPRAPTDLLLAALRRLSRASVRRLGATLAELNAVLGFREAELLFASDD